MTLDNISEEELFELIRECDRVQKIANVVYNIWDNFPIVPTEYQLQQDELYDFVYTFIEDVEE